MQILIDEAAKGKWAVLTGLYEKYWRDAKVLCVGLLFNESYAENARSHIRNNRSEIFCGRGIDGC